MFMRQAFILGLLILFSSSCISANKEKNKKSTINQLELQEDLQRFYTRFTERIIDASYKEKTLTDEHKNETLRQYLLYDSEVLKIVTAPFPVANLMDTMVFIKLNKIVIQDYWIPNVYSPSGQSILKAFDDSEKDLEQVALKVIKSDKISQIDQFVQVWREENPDQIRVEKIRLADFSKFAQSNNKKKSSFSIVDTESAVQAVDQMILVANRGIFLAQQLPFIVRLHTRLGTQEILTDAIHSLQSAPALIHELNETHTLVTSFKDLVVQMDYLAKDSKSILEILPKNFKGGIDVHKTFLQLDSILLKTSYLIEQIKSERAVNTNVLKELKNELHSFIWFLVFTFIFAGSCISVVWWTSSFFYKKLLQKT